MLKGKKRYLKFNQAINEAIIQSIDKDKKVVVFGEGVQDPSSMWGTLKGINKKFGPKNTVEMPVSENSLIGAAIGASNFGIKSIVCLNRVEFAMYAFEQIFNNAAKSNFLTNGVHRSPIVIRLAIGRGWGQGPTHSQSMESVFSYFPGLKVVMPLMPSDAKDILISSIFDPNPVVFLEHRWLYDIEEHVEKSFKIKKISSFKKLTNGKDLTIVSSAYGSLEALKVSEFLKTKNIDIENYNLQMFKPLDISKIYKSVKKTGKLITIDTGHIIYGASSEIITSLVSQNEKIFDKKPIRLGLPDIPTPSSRGYVKNYYPNSIMILSNILDLFNYNKKTKNTLINEFKKKYNVKSIYDVPNKEFKGPF